MSLDGIVENYLSLLGFEEDGRVWGRATFKLIVVGFRTGFMFCFPDIDS